MHVNLLDIKKEKPSATQRTPLYWGPVPFNSQFLAWDEFPARDLTSNANPHL